MHIRSAVRNLPVSGYAGRCIFIEAVTCHDIRCMTKYSVSWDNVVTRLPMVRHILVCCQMQDCGSYNPADIIGTACRHVYFVFDALLVVAAEILLVSAGIWQLPLCCQHRHMINTATAVMLLLPYIQENTVIAVITVHTRKYRYCCYAVIEVHIRKYRYCCYCYYQMTVH